MKRMVVLWAIALLGGAASGAYGQTQTPGQTELYQRQSSASPSTTGAAVGNAAGPSGAGASKARTSKGSKPGSIAGSKVGVHVGSISNRRGSSSAVASQAANAPGGPDRRSFAQSPSTFKDYFGLTWPSTFASPLFSGSQKPTLTAGEAQEYLRDYGYGAAINPPEAQPPAAAAPKTGSAGLGGSTGQAATGLKGLSGESAIGARNPGSGLQTGLFSSGGRLAPSVGASFGSGGRMSPSNPGLSPSSFNNLNRGMLHSPSSGGSGDGAGGVGQPME